MELDASKEIESIYGNENEIELIFPNNMGSLYIYIDNAIDTENNLIVNQDEVCRYIRDKLDRLSKLTIEDIDLILNMEMEYLQSKGIVD